jgi:hypothetical protein
MKRLYTRSLDPWRDALESAHLMRKYRWPFVGSPFVKDMTIDIAVPTTTPENGQTLTSLTSPDPVQIGLFVSMLFVLPSITHVLGHREGIRRNKVHHQSGLSLHA